MSEDQRNQLEMAFAACALRFRARDYLGDREEECWDSAFGEGRNPFALEDDPAENFARLYLAQRALAKCGPGFCADREPLSLAAAFLFLHLYREPTPAEWRHEEIHRQWESDHRARRETYAAWVREWLVTGLPMSNQSS
jgi:hypothetical protein